MNNTRYTNNLIPIDNLIPIFDSKIQNEDYDYIYISIGSKYVDENSCYAKDQMVPNFVRRLKNKKILLVIIDDFNNNDNFHYNVNLINDQLIISNSKDIDVLIVNGFFYSYSQDKKTHNINKNFITKFFSFSTLENIDFNPYFITIANFVKFEKYFEANRLIQNNISQLITKYLNQKYKYSFFEWSGYNMLGEFLYPGFIDKNIRDRTLSFITYFFVKQNIKTKKINLKMFTNADIMEYLLLNNDKIQDFQMSLYHYFNYVENQYKHNEKYWMKNIVEDISSQLVKKFKNISK